MANMSDTFTGTIVAASKTAGRHKGKAISSASIMGTVAVLAWLGINPLDFVVGNASVFQDYKQKHWELYTRVGKLQTENRDFRKELLHGRHIVESQNFVLLVLFRNELISIEDYTNMVHAVDHRRDSL